MRTSKPISTISYNSEQYLTLKLEELRKAKKIEFWAFIYHQREKDDKKEHIHLLIFPAKMLQTMDLEDEFKEPDLKHPELPPLGVKPFRLSKFDDFYLYGLHDPSYLASKGQSREYRYAPSDYRSSDLDYLAELASMIDWTAFTVYKLIEDGIAQGMTFAKFVKLHAVPVQQLKGYEIAWNLMIQDHVERNGRISHTPVDTPPEVDPGTGEVITSVEAQKRPQSDLRKSDDTLRMEIINEASKNIQAASPSYYEVHPQSEYVPFDPDTELPW